MRELTNECKCPLRLGSVRGTSESVVGDVEIQDQRYRTRGNQSTRCPHITDPGSEPPRVCCLFTSWWKLLCLLERINRGLGGEEGERCRCYERRRDKDWGDRRNVSLKDFPPTSSEAVLPLLPLSPSPVFVFWFLFFILHREGKKISRKTKK